MAYSFECTVRNDFGKGASRRLRRNNQVPAIIYGGNQDALAVALDHAKVFTAQQNKSFYEEPITLNVNGSALVVKPVAMQRHPVNGAIVHIDFMRA
ncbi:MAG: 50S ribosomal protein L25 [Succinivibrionaceae bacterium]|nr:50S ribosomal protein L25 [Ruminobacter sp.]MDY5779738.1 50S ribosomal protein L25 [Succinivibrionaceae bacterium]MEE1339966.1 50S ribosomal protein L25 [Succinivibrionaceae bacterium]